MAEKTAEKSKTTDIFGGAVVDFNEAIKTRVRDYETIFIISPTVDTATAKQLTEKLTKLMEENHGELLRMDDWGKIRMAYEMENHHQGHYYYVRYFGNVTTTKAIERMMKLDVAFLRYQTVRLSENLSETEKKTLRDKVPTEKLSPPHVLPEEDGEFSSFRS